MVAGVTNHMRQRILDQLKDLAIEFRIRPEHLKVDLLAELLRKIANDARKLCPSIANWLHPRLHDAFLQLGNNVV